MCAWRMRANRWQRALLSFMMSAWVGWAWSGLKRVLGLGLDVALAFLGVGIGRQVVDCETVGFLSDLDEEGDAPAAGASDP